jgi:asparagine synthetase B (glutamine-hydrolysing)
MCSFIFTDREIKDLNYINFYTKFRGPDKTSVKKYKNYTYVHNLLSITGEFIEQPFIDEKNEIACVYNGEIYNYINFGNYKSDGECLIPLYKEYGEEFIKKLDGEYAVILVDYKNEKIIISSDIFKTKPIFYSLSNGIGVATYSTPLKNLGYTDIVKLQPNTTLVIDLKTNKIKNQSTVHDFDVSNQHKLNFDDWIESFKNSIKKRTSNLRESVFIGLSSGYDSGAICCELLNQHVKFKSYSVIGSENQRVLQDRFSKLDKNEYQLLTKYPDEIKIAHDYIKLYTEHFQFVTYSNSSDYNEYWLSLIDDNGAKHLSHLCSYAIKDRKKILLSGQGADEIFSDYGFGGIKKYKHSNFGGLFPNDLSKIFPWPSFFNSSMESYLAKEEYVAGSYGIEARYPFLDKNVVQEFLWLSPTLKNSKYKSVLDIYLKQNNFPYSESEKIGF